MDRITALVDKHDLILVEDCAHAIETQWHGKPAGTFGDFGCFSFYVTKNVITGEAMMVPRCEAVPVRIPLPPAPDASSIFKTQKSGGANSVYGAE